jgi:hypothetical protein
MKRDLNNPKMMHYYVPHSYLIRFIDKDGFLRETHPYNEFKPGCEKRFTTFYGFVAKSGLKTKNFI